MIALRTNRAVLQSLCVLPAAKTASKWKKLFYIMLNLTVLTAHVCASVSSGFYFARFSSNDLESSLFAILQISGHVNMAYMLVIAVILRHQIAAIVDRLEVIYKTHKNDDSSRFLATANNQSEWMWKFYFVFMMGGSALNTAVLASLSAFHCWQSNENITPMCLSHPFVFVLPWNQQTMLGYFGEIVFDIATGETYLTSGSFILFFISLCQHHQAFSKMFEHLINKLDQSPGKRNANEILCTVVRFHISAKDLFLESSKAFSYFILVQMICTVVVLACAVYQFDLLFKHINFGMSFVLMLISINILNLFLYCYFGKMATDSFGKMAIHLYQVKWHHLSIDLQKYFIVMIGNAQRPLYYHGFRVAVLNLETFTNFLRSVYSCYMIFKTITPE